MQSIFTNYFENEIELPQQYEQTQCISFNDEILICGGFNNQKCYSYHTTKRQYKYICSYPENIELKGHCVVQLVHLQTSPNELHLLSFGGQGANINKATFSMEYKSVWENNEVKSDSNSNTWIKQDNVHTIGEPKDDLEGVRALIGGSKNNLLFMIYSRKNIKVIDLINWKTVLKCKVQLKDRTYLFCYTCFVHFTINNININRFILFCQDVGIEIQYDEECNKLSYKELQSGWNFNKIFFSYVCLYDHILLFGEMNAQLPIALSFSFAIVNGHDKKIHIIGGVNNDNKQIHWVADVVKIYGTSSLLGIAQSYEVDILQNELVRSKNGSPYPLIVKRRRIQSPNERFIKRFEKEKKDIEILEDKYKRSNDQSIPDVNTMHWYELWSCNGQFKASEAKLLDRLQDISQDMTTVLLQRTNLKVYFYILLLFVNESEIILKELNEIKIRKNSIQEQINVAFVSKEKLKKEIDVSILKYIDCMTEYNNLYNIQTDLSNEEELIQERMRLLDEICTYDENVFHEFEKLNNTLNSLLENHRKLETWVSEDIASFVRYNLNFTTTELQSCKNIIDEKKICAGQLFVNEIDNWKNILNLNERTQAIILSNSLKKIFAKYYRNKYIPKEFLCALSNLIMSDPVIALNGTTYDRLSITNNFRDITCYPSLMEDGKLILIPNHFLKNKIKEFFESTK
ncbi:hypothetical protein RFI_35372 [Reticulomyxa filosa]|uniref:U-box domain-containing protein n=1 Tax=Reticulomyxa filosa TaxID=46433 RepID=X6LKC4_RETFI|nr:hypothetical protein RFI_35372 [Reticulomyxa filosa]|eukprot:ETO02064.1 hypothetical protein RFI_35372 [Reticulomyxa filosa]